MTAFFHVADDIFHFLRKNETEEMDGHGNDQAEGSGQKSGFDVASQFRRRHEMTFLADFVKDAHEAQKGSKKTENRRDVAEARQNFQATAQLWQFRHVCFICRMASCWLASVKMCDDGSNDGGDRIRLAIADGDGFCDFVVSRDVEDTAQEFMRVYV